MFIFKPTLWALVVFTFIQSATAQRSILEGQQATLFKYSFTLTDEFQRHLSDLAKDNEPVVEIFMHKTYERIKSTIQDCTGLIILPKETLAGKVPFNIYDYPAATRKKALQNGDTPFYIKISVEMSARETVDEETSYQKRKIKAYCGIKVTFYNEQGKKLHSAKGKAKGNRWIVLDRKALYGFIPMNGPSVKDEQQTLISVLEEALENLKMQLPK